MNRRMTTKVPLQGGQDRLRQAILYVADKNASARHFGAIKLNKIIWRADFKSFSERGIPVTGREYRRQKFGPAAHEMLPVHREMFRDGLIRVDKRDFGEGIQEERTVALVAANLKNFTSEDISYFDESTSHYWLLTGEETSDESHGVAWQTRFNGDPMPYELSLLSDEPLDRKRLARTVSLIYERGWASE